MQWERVSDDVVPINISCVEDTPKTVFQVTAYNKHVEKIFDVRILQPGRFDIKYFPFYAPNFEKVGSILLWACPCVCVRLSVQKKIQARVLKFHIWIPHQKIAFPYF